ncbi:MAG: 3-phosphoshikimate 1-carboxyvinyltransferase [Oscillospiraceae bacterium]|nr:3-phosphoshikimate 1-carboxyvinyltransferase [Oscillospiraceae bacterium]
MILSISPSSPKGDIVAPPSKSYAHRALICAGLAGGISKISNISFSEDIKATLDCLSALGAKIEINGNTAIITGISDFTNFKGAVLNCNESGSTLRFFIPLCLLSNNEITLNGTQKLISRPLSVYEDIAKNQGLLFQKDLSSVKVKGKLKSGNFSVKGNISSQFISGLLFALPLLENDSEINIISPFESKPYVDMTVSILKNFGIEIDYSGLNLKIKGNQQYKPQNTTVEGDWSNAAFLYAFKSCGADVNVHGVDMNSSQGDKICLEYFDALKNETPELDLTDCPDLAPIMFAFAGLHNGAVFTGTDRLRFKESDRISCMQTELAKFGIKLVTGDNRVIIKSGDFHTPTENIFGHNDHRIVMANAFLLCKTGGKIEGYEAVKKSFPNFFDVLLKAGVNLNYET